MNLEASNLEHHARIVAQKDARIAELEQLNARLLEDAKALTRENGRLADAAPTLTREQFLADPRAAVLAGATVVDDRGNKRMEFWTGDEAPAIAPFDSAEYERRVGSVRRLLETFERRHPYTDNVAQRIVQWAVRGFTGEP